MAVGLVCEDTLKIYIVVIYIPYRGNSVYTTDKLLSQIQKKPEKWLINRNHILEVEPSNRRRFVWPIRVRAVFHSGF